MIQGRLIHDLEPLWELISSSQDYSPFWLLARELFPVAESIGDLIHGSSNNDNLQTFIDVDMAKISNEYSGKGAILAHLFRHSLLHTDEPRSIYAGNISIYWSIGFLDGRYHLLRLDKDPRNRSCVIQLDVRQFYEDLLVLLEHYKYNGPKSGVAKRYNSWTFKKYDDPAVKLLVKNFYQQN